MNGEDNSWVVVPALIGDESGQTKTHEIGWPSPPPLFFPLLTEVKWQSHSRVANAANQTRSPATDVLGLAINDGAYPLVVHGYAF